VRYHKIPDETVRRLPIYLRGLLFSSEHEQQNISSQDLADLLGFNPWQIRKDFSYFGDFGTRGVGYNVEKLAKQIKKFDIDSKKIGRKVKNITIEDASNLQTLKKRKINLAIVTVPPGAAQQTADALVNAGVKGILNFSPCYITVPKKVKVITIDIAMDLARLPYYMPAG
jgi:redox-sensing transcriptional repressor